MCVRVRARAGGAGGAGRVRDTGELATTRAAGRQVKKKKAGCIFTRVCFVCAEIGTDAPQRPPVRPRGVSFVLK